MFYGVAYYVDSSAELEKYIYISINICCRLLSRSSAVRRIVLLRDTEVWFYLPAWKGRERERAECNGGWGSSLGQGLEE